LHYENTEERLMPIAKITGQGLATIACSVALLWGFIAGEKLTVRHARQEYAQTMRDLRQLQRRVPVSAPRPATQNPQPGRVSVG
jgi:hypothetical protein